MLANPFHNRRGSAIPHSEALPRAAGDKEHSSGGPIERSVADKHIAAMRRLGPRGNGNRAPAQTLTHIVIRFSLETEAQAGDQERTKALAGDSAKLAITAFSLQSTGAKAAHDLSTEVRADAAVSIDNGVDRRPRGRPSFFQQAGKLAVEAGVLLGELRELHRRVWRRFQQAPQSTSRRGVARP